MHTNTQRIVITGIGLTRITSYNVCYTKLLRGMLNTKGRFFVPAIASSFFNLGSIVAGTGLAFILPRYGQPAITGMAIGTLVGGILQLGIQLPSLKKA